jgi:REP element-mobilizing transposase RayT
MAAKILLEPEKYYHVYNHAISNEMLFNDENDYKNFIKRYLKYIIPICDTLAYCLMPNHFHWCIRIKPLDEMNILPSKYLAKYLTENSINTGIFRCISHFFNGYVQSYNKKYRRMGGLFVGNFKRREIQHDDDMRRLICYIHNNPVESGLAEFIDEWSFSSYSEIFQDQKTHKIPICTEEILRVFDDKENYIYMHKEPFKGLGTA